MAALTMTAISCMQEQSAEALAAFWHIMSRTFGREKRTRLQVALEHLGVKR